MHTRLINILGVAQPYAVPIAFLIISLFVYKDYGISWDEQIQREHGLVTAEYINQQFSGALFSEDLIERPPLPEYEYRIYGTWFQTICTFIELKTGISQRPDYYYIRHIGQLILFCIALYFFGRLIQLRFNNRWISLIGMILLASTPRILSHQFYNPKDAIFLSTYIFYIWALFKLIKKYTVRNAFIAGALVGLTIATRMLGIYPFLLTLLLAILGMIAGVYNKKQTVRVLASFMISAIAFSIILWPSLWENPIDNFIHSYQSLATYEWKGINLLDGKTFLGTECPWYYIPRWIMITTPLPTLLLITVGLLIYNFSILTRLCDRKHWDSDTLLDLGVTGAWLGPLVMVIILNSTLYTGWRHLHFIYPALLLSGLWLLNEIKKTALRYSLAFLITSHLLYISITTHPLQSVYFNTLAKEPWIENNDLDYWGVGFKYALEEFTRRGSIPEGSSIKASIHPGWEAYHCMSPHWRSSRPWHKWQSGKHLYLCNMRNPRRVKAFIQKEEPYEVMIDSLTLNGNIIYGLFKQSED